ncbi:MAG TPA: peptidoglycan editing factor PgeF [Noviherbaspirillum sp.]
MDGNWISPEWQAPNNVGALSTTRKGGVSTGPYGDASGKDGLNLGLHVEDDADYVRRNRALLRAELPSEPAWLNQVHGNTVVDAALVSAPVDADASVTTQPGVVCAVQTADCLPVLFCDSGGKVVGAAHAGWRGLASGVLENTVRRMRDAGAENILAWLGPAIGPSRFEVGQDVFDAFAGQDPAAARAFKAAQTTPRKYLADIYLLARQRLERQGVVQVSGGGFCTVSDSERFYSFRRDRVTGRMASLIWLKHAAR